MARVREAEGDLDGALDLLDEAERLYVSDFSPNVRPVPALRARVWVAQGRLGEALGWARERGLSVDDDLSYLREFEHITLARVLLARYASERAERSMHEAIGLLERLLQAAEDGRADGKRHRDPGAAGARPPGARRHPCCAGAAGTRPDAGRAGGLRPDLRGRGPADGGAAESGRETAGSPRAMSVDSWPPSAQAEDRRPVRQGLIEPLSERELDVLRLLGTDLDGPDIARELMVSLNTVRTHTKNIYAKLGVNNRRAAVRPGRGLDAVAVRDHCAQSTNHHINHHMW